MRGVKSWASVLLMALLVVPALSACAESKTQQLEDSVKSASASPPPASAYPELLESVKVTPTSEDTPPDVKFQTPLSIPQPAVKEVIQGQGKEIQKGQQLLYRIISFNAVDASERGNNYADPKPATQVVNSSLRSLSPALESELVKARVGSYIAIGNPMVQSFRDQQGQEVPAKDPILSVIYLEDILPLPEKASADEVSQLDADGRLPQVQLNGDAAPTVQIPQRAAPDKLVVKVLKEGSGETLKENDVVDVNYIGWDWTQAKEFDSTYSKGRSASFNLDDSVIPGWSIGLAGQKVGSTVELVIPSALAYGDDPGNDKTPAGPLVFVIEIKGKK